MLLAAVLGLSGGVALATAPSSSSPLALAVGRARKYEWAVRIQKRTGPAGEQRPCLSASALWRLGPYNYRRTRYRQCAETSGPLTPTEGPLIASAGQPSDRASPRITAVGMIFAPEVRRVQITMAGGAEKVLRLDELTPLQAHATGLRRLRYAAFVVHGAWCAERLVSRSASGKALWDSGTDQYACAPTR